MKALVYYNPYYPTHIFATVCLWITCKLFLDRNLVVFMNNRTEITVRHSSTVFILFKNNHSLVCIFIASTWHAYTLHCDYQTFLAGMDSRMTEAGSTGGSTVFTKVSSKFSVGRLKKKKGSKPRKLTTSIMSYFTSDI